RSTATTRPTSTGSTRGIRRSPTTGRSRRSDAMKGVILAGGLGTRLHPLTKITNKHLLPVYDRPMIHYPLRTLVDAGIRDILIVAIEEKSQRPKSDYAVIGIYMYDAAVFDIIGGLTPSARNELEITDVNNAYIARGEMQHDVLEGWWTDAGTFESLFRANQ